MPSIGAQLEKPFIMNRRVQRLKLSSIEAKSNRFAPYSGSKNLHPNHIDLNKVFGDHKKRQAQKEAKRILKKVSDRLLAMYREQRANILETIIKRGIYAYSFEQIQLMGDEEKDAYRRAAKKTIKEVQDHMKQVLRANREL